MVLSIMMLDVAAIAVSSDVQSKMLNRSDPLFYGARMSSTWTFTWLCTSHPSVGS
jgi:hypothetical protein